MRCQVWLTLADQYLHSISIDWEKTLRFAFNERSNPDDDSLGIQIVKVTSLISLFVCVWPSFWPIAFRRLGITMTPTLKWTIVSLSI